MLAEGLLQGAKLAVRCQAFDCKDVRAICLHRQHETGPHGKPVNYDGAGAANAMFAADMGSRQPQIVAQRVSQRGPRLCSKFRSGAVDGEGDDAFIGHAASLSLISEAQASARRQSAEECTAIGTARMDVVFGLHGSSRRGGRI